jgi:hypothetical protein
MDSNERRMRAFKWLAGREVAESKSKVSSSPLTPEMVEVK